MVTAGSSAVLSAPSANNVIATVLQRQLFAICLFENYFCGQIITEKNADSTEYEKDFCFYIGPFRQLFVLLCSEYHRMHNYTHRF